LPLFVEKLSCKVFAYFYGNIYTTNPLRNLFKVHVVAIRENRPMTEKESRGHFLDQGRKGGFKVAFLKSRLFTSVLEQWLKRHH
jgi:hypothetical protein